MCVCVCVWCAVVTAPLQLATQFGPFLEDNGEREREEREREEREGKGMRGRES